MQVVIVDGEQETGDEREEGGGGKERGTIKNEGDSKKSKIVPNHYHERTHSQYRPIYFDSNNDNSYGNCDSLQSRDNRTQGKIAKLTLLFEVISKITPFAYSN